MEGLPLVSLGNRHTSNEAQQDEQRSQEVEFLAQPKEAKREKEMRGWHVSSSLPQR